MGDHGNGGSTDDRLDRLEREVRALRDRQEILDVVQRHARGHDRHDVDLMTAAFHDDGVDEHGATVNPGPEYAAWANAVHGASSQQHLHNVTTHTCEIDGDTAHCESYVMVALLDRDGRNVRVLNGRYLDRLERRNGAWRIALRRSTCDLAFTADAAMLASSAFRSGAFPKGTRDHSDLSYLRPLTLEADAPARW